MWRAYRAGDGTVTIDSPSPVRRTTGIRLPSTAADGPTLRAGFARPQLLALTGDLQITGKLGVGTPDPEAELDVRGLARVGQLSVREQAFKVAGDEATFYPVVFRDLDWTAGQCILEIVRPSAQADAANAGSLMARLRWHAPDGQGSDLLDADVVQTRRFLANARTLGSDRLLVVWLRGNRSYAWRSRQRVELVDASAGTKTLGGEKLEPRQTIDPLYDRDRVRISPTLDRQEIRGGLTVTGDLHHTGLLSHLDVADAPAATIRAADLNLGHSSRRGTPGRALVDLKDQLALNYNGDWPQTTIQGQKTQITGDAQLDRTLTVTGGVQGDLTLNTGNLKLTAGALTVAKTSQFNDQVSIVRAAEALRLVRPKTTTGGSTNFLELFQEDANPPTTPDTNPYIRFHHGNRYWYRLEIRRTGFHLLDGGADTYAELFARTIKATGDLATDGALTVAKASTFTGAVRVSRETDHLTLHRAPTETTGGSRLFLELIQEDTGTPKVPDVNMFIRFHHNYRWWHRLEARASGLHLLEGSGDNLHDLYAGNLYSQGLAVTAGRAERLYVVRGIVDSSNNISEGSGFSVSRDNGLTKVTFTTAFASVPAVTVTQQYPNGGDTSNTGSTLDNAVITHCTRGAVWIKTGNGKGEQDWRKFHFIAIGT